MLDTFVVGTLDSFSGVTVHEAPVITHGFEGDARALRLLHAAFEGLQTQLHEPRSARTAFYLSLSHPDRAHTGIELIADEDLRRQERARWEQIQAERIEPDLTHRATSLLERAAHLAGWDGPVRLRSFSMSGNTGIAEMTEMASRDLGAGIVDVAVVGGVDSWIDAASLRWLELRGRLKSPTTPAGLAPGEAAGFLVIEAIPRVAARGGRIQAVLQSTLLNREQRAQLLGEISVGESLAATLAQIASVADWSAEAHPWIIVDHNGESYRSREWGCALTRLVNEHRALQDPVMWYPVISVGDTGAATGIVQTSVVLQAFDRGYAAARQAVLVAGADGGERSATLLEAPN